MEQQNRIQIPLQEQLIEQSLEQNYKGLCRTAYTYVRNEQDALDIVQESAYKAMKYCGNLREPQYAAAWLYRIVRNESVSFLRRQKQSVPLEELDGGMEASYADVDLHQAIAKLDTGEQTVVFLRYFDGFSFRQMAEILQENINTIKSRLYRALHKLRRLLEGHCALM